MCVYQFSVAVIKHHEEGNFRTREFVLAYDSRGMRVHGGNGGMLTSDSMVVGWEAPKHPLP